MTGCSSLNEITKTIILKFPRQSTHTFTFGWLLHFATKNCVIIFMLTSSNFIIYYSYFVTNRLKLPKKSNDIAHLHSLLRQLGHRFRMPWETIQATIKHYSVRDMQNLMLLSHPFSDVVNLIFGGLVESEVGLQFITHFSPMRELECGGLGMLTMH